jgi:hypothetical protein
MIYSPVFSSLPAEMKQRIYQRMRAALSAEPPDKDFTHLPTAEKRTIREILKATLTDLPSGW